MKKLVLSTIVMAFVVIGCNSNSDNGNNNETTETTTMDNTTMDTTTHHEMEMPEAEQQFACSMHPEVIGKRDEDCSKCGMKLTVPVKNSENQE